MFSIPPIIGLTTLTSRALSHHHCQSVVHTIGENQKRGVVKVVLEICSTSIKIVICVESRECPVQTSVKTGTTLIIVT